MKRLNLFAIVLAGTGTAAMLCSPLEAAQPGLQVLYSFAGGQDASDPRAALVADSSGNLYGTTVSGGGSAACDSGCGAVFELSPPKKSGGAWAEKVLHRFTGGSDGSGPLGKLVLDKQGNLYGTTYQGGDLTVDACTGGLGNVFGCGVVFELSPPALPGGTWTETVLYSFEGSDGAYPSAGPVFDEIGNLYATTSAGGSSTQCFTNQLPGCGRVFELSPPNQTGGQWTYAGLYDFTGGNDGAISFSDLTFDLSGNLYGTTCSGGTNGGGVVFELSPPMQQNGDWMDTTLVSFPTNACPRAGVVFDSASNLFGTTSMGGEFGTVFELTPSSSGGWTESVIYQFDQLSAEYPYSTPLLDSVGNLYGTTSGGRACGVLYRLHENQGAWHEEQYSFSSSPEIHPCGSQGALIFGKQNALFGTSGGGGTCRAGTCGTVFGAIP